MILHIDGDINTYYVQTLCMLYFPGAKFGTLEENAPDTPVVHVKAVEDGEGNCLSTVSISLDERTCTGEGSAKQREGIDSAHLMKIAVGRAFCAAGSAFLGGYTPPWGILTGVRPSKVAGEYLALGNGVRGTRRILSDEYFVNPKKAALAVQVAATEQKLLRKIASDFCSIYISIPFCPSRCAYCSFVSYTSDKLLSLIDEYLVQLYQDVRNVFSIAKDLGMRVASVYIGGGTPTVLSASQLEQLLTVISESCDIASLIEFTVEAGRPDTITEEKLAVMHEFGVTRISVNPQTLDPDVMQAIGRRHTVEDFYRAYELAKNSGIRDINVDLIAGLPADNFSKFSKTMDEVLRLAPTNLTVHTFSVKKASDIRKTNTNVYSLTGGDAAKSVDYALMKAKAAGYRPYYMYRQKNTVGNLENVGYALDGSECMYNIFMMEEIQPIFGAGAGAVTKLLGRDKSGTDKVKRIFSPKYPYEYLRDAEKNRLGDPEEGKLSLREKIFAYYGKEP